MCCFEGYRSVKYFERTDQKRQSRPSPVVDAQLCLMWRGVKALVFGM
jgi:hypothetical protein